MQTYQQALLFKPAVFVKYELRTAMLPTTGLEDATLDPEVKHWDPVDAKILQPFKDWHYLNGSIQQAAFDGEK